jgi:hypothetical protein
VLVNGKLVDRSLLYNGDVVSLGQFRLKVELNEVPVEEPSPPDHISVEETEIMPIPAYESPSVRIIKS